MNNLICKLRRYEGPKCNKRKVRSNRDKTKLVSHFWGSKKKKKSEEEERRREEVEEEEKEKEERYGWLGFCIETICVWISMDFVTFVWRLVVPFIGFS